MFFRETKMRLLDRINHPNDIKKIPARYYGRLAAEIREFLVDRVSKTGGHLASNLGAVEITMALHLCLDLPKDKIIYDVGHQSYVHKLLTGRKDAFESLRQKDGLCGFPKPSESPCDAFGTGHSSTSISAALGFVTAREIKGSDEKIVAVIGDGALSGGMAFEALNNLSKLAREKTNLVIILNDNKMSIARNVGGMSRYLSDLRSTRSYTEFKENVEKSLNNIPGLGKKMSQGLKRSKDSIKGLFVKGMLFENMDITYYGPVDGHDIQAMIQAVNRAVEHPGPILIHALTVKGKGYEIAEKDPERFHGVDPFNKETGELLKKNNNISCTQVFSDTLVRIGREREDVCAITAAMPSGTGLMAFAREFPNRFFDVGIAEEHAVTFAAGLAAAGLHPVFAVYSSFLQRAYDSILHDVCIQKLPVTFCIDRSGLVGADGETHQGIFDVSYLSHIPNLLLMAPKNRWELEEMIRFAVSYPGPSAVKYPRGQAYEGLEEYRTPLEAGVSETIFRGEEFVLIGVGHIMEECVGAVRLLEEEGCKPGLINARFLSPPDEEGILEAADRYPLIVTVEENALAGGFGQKVSAILHNHGRNNKLLSLGIGRRFIPHAKVEEQRQMAGIDARSIADRILAWRRSDAEDERQTASLDKEFRLRPEDRLGSDEE